MSNGTTDAGRAHTRIYYNYFPPTVFVCLDDLQVKELQIIYCTLQLGKVKAGMALPNLKYPYYYNGVKKKL